MSIRGIVLGIATAALLAGPACAQTKIGLIDLTKVFEGYYKTKAAKGLLRDQEDELRKNEKVLLDQYQKSTDDYKKAFDDSNNQAISADEREKKKKAAESNLLELKRLEEQLTQFKRSADTTLNERMLKMRENIMEEIRAVVNAKAKSGGFSMVLDTSGESFNRAPTVLYNNGENDITTSVLLQLNASEPPSFKGDKKEEKGSLK